MGSTESKSEEAAGRRDALGEKLSVDDAWKIAMLWQSSLRGAMRLVVDNDGPVTSIVESYAWIQVDLSVIARNTASKFFKTPDPASIARAAALSWLWLSHCRGYGATENPLFWKRVFSQLQDEKEAQGTRHFAPIGFFDQPGKVFPRFVIITSSTTTAGEFPDQPVRDFCGLPGYEMDGGTGVQLDQLKHRLGPYITSDGALDTATTVDVCIRIQHTTTITSTVISQLAKLVNDVNAVSSSNSSWRPHFKITDLTFGNSLQIMRDFDTMTQAYHLLQSVCVRIGLLQFGDTTAFLPGDINNTTPFLNGRVAKALAVSALLGLDGHGFQAKTTTVVFARRQQDNKLVASVASALPFARSAHTIQLTGRVSEMRPDLPWLAYAIFHPQTKHSSWRHLDLSDFDLALHASTVWSAMARGNNLLALLDGTPTTNDTYYWAQLRSGTAVMTAASPAADILFFVVADKETQDVVVDVCGIASLDPATWGSSSWVAVVLPAYGLGWVRPHDLCNVRARSPSQPTLTGLTLRCTFTSNPVESQQAMPEMLRAVGSSLTYLNIQSYHDIASSTLGQVLCACPKLRSLVVSHNGEYWSWPVREASGDCDPQLHEIELHISSYMNAVVPRSMEHLRQLRAIRFHVLSVNVKSSLSKSVCRLQQLLRQAQYLQYVQWRERSTSKMRPRPLVDTMMDASRLDRPLHALHQLGIQDPDIHDHDKYLYADVPLSASCAAAFLSVVSHRGSTAWASRSVVGRLRDRDLLMNIFTFATSCELRDINIDYW